MKNTGKKLKKIIISILILFSITLIHTQGISAEEKNQITITDSNGRTVSINRPIERVAILNDNAAEIMRALGVEDKIVGIHQVMQGNSYWSKDIQEKPVVASFAEINYEMLAEVQPQLVISSTTTHGVVGEQGNLRAFDIVDIKLNLRRPELIKDEILLLGKIFDREKEAHELLEFYQYYEDLISSTIKEIPLEDRPTIFLEYHAGDFATSGKESRFYEQTILAGAVNIASEFTGDYKVNAEWVIERNPDLILREHGGALGFDISSYDLARHVREEIMNRPGMQFTRAVQEGDVYILPIDIYSRPRYIVGVAYLAKWLYPDLFHDLNPDLIHQEYLERFQGLEYRGIWAYPEKK
ncbi:ABC transporter substrate-binding protein [Natronospora cellulosivora (SeqCode)]